jgi:hypothetical protein
MRRVRQVGDRERELRSHIRQLFAGVGFRRFHDGLDPAATLRKEIAANGDASAVALAAFGRELKPRLDRLLALPEASQAHWGIKIVSLDTGKTLYSLDERKLFTPASNTKLFTTALALATLGPDFRFHTTVEAAGPPDKHGRVAGDVWLMGRGDPNLSGRALTYTGRTERDGPPPRALDALADQLVSRGLRYVDGDLVADDTYFVFERFGEGWSQNDLVWGYAAPVSALAINDNALFLQVLPGEKPGDPAQVKLDPPEPYYRVQNRVRTVEGRSPPGPSPRPGAPAFLSTASRVRKPWRSGARSPPMPREAISGLRSMTRRSLRAGISATRWPAAAWSSMAKCAPATAGPTSLTTCGRPGRCPPARLPGMCLPATIRNLWQTA